MGPISPLTQHIADRNGISFSNFSVLNARNVTANRWDFSREQILCASTAQTCWDQMVKIPKRVGDFIVHRYADMRMFLRALSSMLGSTTVRDIHNRENELCQFKRVMQESQVNSETASTRFASLAPQTQALFFYTDAAYIARFQNETDPARAETLRYEILRECYQAISLQLTLTVVNTFYRSCLNRSTPVTSVHPEAPSLTLWEVLSRFFGYTRSTGPYGREDSPVPGPMTASGRTLPGVDLDIPGTVPYVQDAIPAAIQTKAVEIAQLRERFTSALPAEYKQFECPASADFMAIPVFDASHPAVQTGLPNLRTALAEASGGTTALQAHRNIRHTIDKDSLEAQIAAGTSYSPAKCMMCRHPEHGGIRREGLRIDTELQEEILQYLRNAVRPMNLS